jgi:hypothetical protein
MLSGVARNDIINGAPMPENSYYQSTIQSAELSGLNYLITNSDVYDFETYELLNPALLAFCHAEGFAHIANSLVGSVAEATLGLKDPNPPPTPPTPPPPPPSVPGSSSTAVAIMVSLFAICVSVMIIRRKRTA